uniref:Aminotran_5 domain-containing protein n=1 Tax=Macrostomum lignano TaxID=282301 RepID=A0A1I8FNL1_9PLAT
SLRCIEDFIQSSVLPRYGNTHSSGSLVALQSNAYREEARRLIKKCVNAGPDDALIFTGSGATGAVQTLIGVLELQELVHGPFEHHSNLLPWRELADVCTRTPLDSAGGVVDMAALEATLKQLTVGREAETAAYWSFLSRQQCHRKTVTDTASVTAMLHAYGAIAVWDYACLCRALRVVAARQVGRVRTRCSCRRINSPRRAGPRRRSGGQAAPFRQQGAARPGGGTVDFVTRDSHQYEADVETRERGRHPAIVDCIRCGLVFRVKRTIGGDRVIENREAELLPPLGLAEFCRTWSPCCYLATGNSARLPIFSPSWWLKYCIDNYPKMKEMCRENDRPGFVRVNLPYFYTNEMVAFCVHAIDMISQHGWKLLPEYTCNPHTGAWRHTDYASQIASLKRFPSGRTGRDYKTAKPKAANPLDNSGLSQQLETRMRWFAMPDEAADSLLLDR